MLQTLKDYKNVFICLIVGVLIKIIFNISFLRSFISIGLPPYYGFITATIFGYLVSFIICIIILRYKYEISFENTLKSFIDILCGALLMILILTIIRFIIPVDVSGRVLSLLIVLLYGFMGASIYFLFAYKTNLTKHVFGGSFFKSLMKIFHLKINTDF